jgi:hypothetical protein
VTFFVQVE